MADIDICICTFRREHIVTTLRSLAGLEVPAGHAVRVIVADNDEVPSAKDRVEAMGPEVAFPISYIHAPKANISVARNACLEAATGRYTLFIDDDELVTPAWLTQMVTTAQTSGADAVLGPVRALYPEDIEGWIRDGDFHSTYPVMVGSEILTGYTCNALLDRRSDKVAGLRFDLSRGKSGGEDTDFFTQIYRRGGTIAYAREAWIEEPVPPARASFRWLRDRRFRSGQTHGRLIREGGLTRPVVVEQAMAAGKAGFSFASAALTFWSPVKRRRNILRGTLHLGTMSGLSGSKEISQY
ncbi:glycosyltransferase family 2 protein [Asticcacaulis sp. ZE23SCel15]|uniref:glycosyltransferase n=1 Tax=Asticcacaulis sp. ZE23SCel15 TaxID=3059027 RepID=UPI00265E4A97|nr:glycosyltransferase family 2 protein [Asticcacaulis sp. ZE23SCel15]WKL58604.1 glycosyltransferase family 2 protein [Asticcacaulis sp. ZE23SCel15]